MKKYSPVVIYDVFIPYIKLENKNNWKNIGWKWVFTMRCRMKKWLRKLVIWEDTFLDAGAMVFFQERKLTVFLR